MLDFQAMISAIGPELLLALAGLLGVLAGAVMGDRFNAISFKLGAATLVLAALVDALYGERDAEPLFLCAGLLPPRLDPLV